MFNISLGSARLIAGFRHDFSLRIQNEDRRETLDPKRGHDQASEHDGNNLGRSYLLEHAITCLPALAVAMAWLDTWGTGTSKGCPGQKISIGPQAALRGLDGLVQIVGHLVARHNQNQEEFSRIPSRRRPRKVRKDFKNKGEGGKQANSILLFFQGLDGHAISVFRCAVCKNPSLFSSSLPHPSLLLCELGGLARTFFFPSYCLLGMSAGRPDQLSEQALALVFCLSDFTISTTRWPDL